MVDGQGRLSLNNIMQVWGTRQGLQLDEVAAAVQLHTATNAGPRFITTALHNDFYIEVRQTTHHTARSSNYDVSQAIGAARPPKRRKFL